jgi:hypothetical protein
VDWDRLRSHASSSAGMRSRGGGVKVEASGYWYDRRQAKSESESESESVRESVRV